MCCHCSVEMGPLINNMSKCNLQGSLPNRWPEINRQERTYCQQRQWNVTGLKEEKWRKGAQEKTEASSERGPRGRGRESCVRENKKKSIDTMRAVINDY